MLALMDWQTSTADEHALGFGLISFTGGFSTPALSSARVVGSTMLYHAFAAQGEGGKTRKEPSVSGRLRMVVLCNLLDVVA